MDYARIEADRSRMILENKGLRAQLANVDFYTTNAKELLAELQTAWAIVKQIVHDDGDLANIAAVDTMERVLKGAAPPAAPAEKAAPNAPSVTCPECAGSGEIDYMQANPCGDTQIRPCWKCGGKKTIVKGG